MRCLRRSAWKARPPACDSISPADDPNSASLLSSCPVPAPIASSASPIGPICFSRPAPSGYVADRIIHRDGQAVQLIEPLADLAGGALNLLKRLVGGRQKRHGSAGERRTGNPDADGARKTEEQDADAEDHGNGGKDLPDDDHGASRASRSAERCDRRITST